MKLENIGNDDLQEAASGLILTQREISWSRPVHIQIELPPHGNHNHKAIK